MALYLDFCHDFIVIIIILLTFETLLMCVVCHFDALIMAKSANEK